VAITHGQGLAGRQRRASTLKRVSS